MLPNFYKFHIVNNTGLTIEFSTDGANNTLTMKAVPWKFDSDGALEYGSELTLMADPTADLTNGSAVEAASEIDNTTNKFLGLQCYVHIATDAVLTANGSIDVYWEWSTDGSSGTFPSDATDTFDAETDLLHVGSIPTVSGDTNKAINFYIS